MYITLDHLSQAKYHIVHAYRTDHQSRIISLFQIIDQKPARKFGLIVVTPAHSPLADAGLRLLTGRKAEDDFAGRRQSIISTLLRQFRVDREIRWPISLLPLYTALRLRPLAIGARENSQTA
jgi:hypothetical protein